MSVELLIISEFVHILSFYYSHLSIELHIKFAEAHQMERRTLAVRFQDQ